MNFLKWVSGCPTCAYNIQYNQSHTVGALNRCHQTTNVQHYYGASVGSAITRGFAQAQTLGFSPTWLGTDVHTLAHSYTSCYMKCCMEWLTAGCNIARGERKTEVSIAYSLVDTTENIDCSSPLPGTFITP